MQRFCAGDEGAFEALFERHAAPVRGMLGRLSGDRTLAADLTQATFLSLVKGRGRFMPGAKFKPWLYAIAMNALRDHHRRHRRERLTDDGDVPEESIEPAQRDLGLEREVRTALAQLPEAQREAVVLHRFEGLSFAEIAQTVGLSESAVKVRAHRGYERLRELLKGAWHGER